MAEVVSTIVTCWNYGRFVGDAIESALLQSYPRVEVIAVDDGSTDDSRQVCEKYPDITYIYKESAGLPAARNTGIRAAQAEYVLCLDADDRLAPRCLEFCVPHFRNYDIVVPGQQEFGGGKEFYHRAHMVTKMTPHNFVKQVNMIHCASLYRRSDWERVDEYDESMTLGLEDAELWWRMVAAGCRIGCIEEPLFFYRIHKSMTATVTQPNRAKIVHYMRRKHHNLLVQLGLKHLGKQGGWN